MRKYMKYEIKGTYRFILGILAIVMIASTIIQLNISKELSVSGPSLEFNGSGFRALTFISSILVIFGAFLTAFFYIVSSFRKELYEDKGYLTFTLPLSGNQILGGKLLVAIIWYAVLTIGIVLYNLILGTILFGSDWTELLKIIITDVPGYNLFSVGIISIISGILTLILIYFSISLSRVSIRNKKIGGIWFILFIILNSLVSYFALKVSAALPYYLTLDGFKILSYYDLNIASTFNATGMESIILMGPDLKLYINIFGQLFQVVIGIIAFLSTGYLIEKKIDL